MLDLQHAFTQLGFSSSENKLNNSGYLELGNLIKYLDQSRPSYVDYRALIKSMQAKPYTWWQETLLNNCFENRNFLTKEGSFAHTLPRFERENKYLRFYTVLITEKLLSSAESRDKLIEYAY